MDFNEVESIVREKTAYIYDVVQFATNTFENDENKPYRLTVCFTIKTGKRKSETLQFFYEIMQKDCGTIQLQYQTPVLHSFGKGKIFYKCKGETVFENYDNQDQLLNGIRLYYCKIDAEMQRAREVEKKGYQGEKTILTKGIVKEEIRKGLYKFSLGRYFILGEYRTLVHREEYNFCHHSFEYYMYRDSIYNRLKGHCSVTNVDEDWVVPHLLRKNKMD